MNQDSKKTSNKGGRKPLSTTKKRKRSNRIDMLFTDDEYSILTSNIKKHYPNFENNKAFYLREYLFTNLNNSNNEENKTLNPSNLNDKLTQRFVFEINKVGSNLNQTLRNLNSKKDTIDSKTLYHLENNIKNLLNLKTEIIQILLNDS